MAMVLFQPQAKTPPQPSAPLSVPRLSFRHRSHQTSTPSSPSFGSDPTLSGSHGAHPTPQFLPFHPPARPQQYRPRADPPPSAFHIPYVPPQPHQASSAVAIECPPPTPPRPPPLQAPTVRSAPYRPETQSIHDSSEISLAIAIAMTSAIRNTVNCSNSFSNPKKIDLTVPG